MIYRYRIKVNKETLKVYALIIASLAVGIGVFFLLPTLPAVIICVISMYMLVTVLKAITKAMSARVITYTDGFSVVMPDGTKMKFEYDRLSYAGFVTEGPQKDYLFVYQEDEDNFLQLPPSFENLAGLRAEIEEHRPVEDCVLEPEETIKKRLQVMFPKKEEPADDEDGTDRDDDDGSDGSGPSDDERE